MKLCAMCWTDDNSVIADCISELYLTWYPKLLKAESNFLVIIQYANQNKTV